MKRFKIGFFVVPLALFLFTDINFFQSVFRFRPPYFFPTLIQHCLSFFLLALIMSCAYGIGAFALTKINSMGPEEKFIFAIPIGLGLMSPLVLILGLLGWMSAWMWIFFLSACILIFRSELRDLARYFLSLFRKSHEDAGTLDPYETFAIGLITWIFLHGLIVALSPTVDADSLAYHLANAQIYLSQSKIFCQWGNLWGAFPGHMEMLYLLALILQGEVLAHLIPWFLSIVLSVAIFLFGSRFFQCRKIGIFSALFFCAQPIFTSFLGTSMQDSSTALYLFLALYGLWSWREYERAQWFIIVGICCGIAVGIKYSALPFALLLFLLLFAIQTISKKIEWKRFCLSILLFILFSSPWTVRNFIWHGNPFWPLLPSITRESPSFYEKTSLIATLEEVPGQERNLKGLLLLPVRMITQMRFGHYYNPEYLSWPLLLILSIICFLRYKPPSLIIWLSLFSTIALIPFFSTASFWRYYLPALPALCIILAWSVKTISIKNPIVIPAMLSLMFVATIRLNHSSQLFPALGFTSSPFHTDTPEESYLLSKLPYYELYKVAQRTIPRDSTVLLLEMSDAFHLERPFLQGDPLFQGWIHYPDYSNSSDLAKALNAQGVRYVIFSEHGHMISTAYDRNRLPNWYHYSMQLIREMLQKNCDLVYRVNDYALYKIL